MTDQPQNPPVDNRKQTHHLNLPEGSEMVERTLGEPVTDLTLESRFELRFDNSKLVIQVRPEIIVGRLVEGDLSRVDVDLTLQGAYQHGVSRRHAALRLHDGSLYIQDLRSTNGTRINGSVLQPEREYRLRDGDEVEFARVRAIIKFVTSKSDSKNG